MKCAFFKQSKTKSAGLFWFFRFLIATSLLVFAFGCGESRKPPLDYMPHMVDSFAVKAQREHMRVPPEGTLPISHQRYHYENDPEGAGRNLKNPLPRSKEILARGQKLYNTYCIVCHGPKGEGKGSIVPKFPQPPSLHSDKVKSWTDGRIYHVITMGQNLMPSYASQMDPEERWAAIHYIRVLQRALDPSSSDLQKAKRGH